MPDKDLVWKEKSRKRVFDTRVFSVDAIQSVSPRGKEGTYSVIESNEWAVIVPVLETEAGKEFVMVKQWRHGAGCLSVEFPGGVIESDEDILFGAKRELREETGYEAKRVTHLATVSPNPAIMRNKLHIFLAEDLVAGVQDLDIDEFIEITRLPVADVIREMGKPPYIHAFMATALYYFGRG
jgi:8-oxo-dGTP pyrophosphatase MutT (NUDIX family)